jgi:ABC-type antimicrobial peptide transport system permease subunit
VLASQLFGVSPRDPVIYGSVTAILLVVGLIASFVPAWRATRVSPVIAMRAE